MKLLEAINLLGIKKSEEIARQEVVALGLAWDDGIGLVFLTCLKDDAQLCPNMGNKKDSPEEAICRWVKKYKNGYDNRPSKACVKPSKTIPDEIINEMIRAKINLITHEEVEKIKFAHRLSMSAENILGLFLEEYIAFKLKDFGWACAWGETLTSVDFCHVNGDLLQVKNRSNTENSSSNKVRQGTNIRKWHRVDATSGRYFWEDLATQSGAIVSEPDFRKFIIESIKENPDSLPLEKGNPWTHNGFQNLNEFCTEIPFSP